MSRFPRGLAVIFVIIVLVPVVFAVFFERVRPDSIGVKQNRLGGVGVVAEDYAPGFRLGILGIHRWYFMPRRTHFLHFTSNGGRDTETTLWKSPLGFRTKDQNECTIEVTVPYRIKDGEAHKIVMDGVRERYVTLVSDRVVAVLRQQLAELTSEDLQNTETRLRRAEEVLPIINADIAEYYVEAEAVLIRRVSFPPEYEAKLQETQYLTQKKNLDQALGLVADEEKVTNAIEAQIGAAEALAAKTWDKRFQEERSMYEVLIAEINAMAKVYESRTKAEGDAEQVKLEAEGQLALDQARALRDRLRNEALASRGGQIYLALKAADNINVPSVTLNSNDPRVPLILDLDELSGLLVGGGGGGDGGDGGEP